jgi:hypothetical protein
MPTRCPTYWFVSRRKLDRRQVRVVTGGIKEGDEMPSTKSRAPQATLETTYQQFTVAA